jgi:hypothetical protein
MFLSFFLFLLLQKTERTFTEIPETMDSASEGPLVRIFHAPLVPEALEISFFLINFF